MLARVLDSAAAVATVVIVRTKQTAQKSTGGRAPRKTLASKAAKNKSALDVYANKEFHTVWYSILAALQHWVKVQHLF